MSIEQALGAQELTTIEITPDTLMKRREFDNCREWLRKRSDDAPEYYSHLLHLVDAEAAWARDDYRTAAMAFDAALEAAATVAPGIDR